MRSTSVDIGDPGPDPGRDPGGPGDGPGREPGGEPGRWDLPPGPDLARALAGVDVSRVAVGEVVAVMVAAERLVSWAQAIALAATAEVVRRDTAPTGATRVQQASDATPGAATDGAAGERSGRAAGGPGTPVDAGRLVPGEATTAEIGCALRLTARAAAARVDLAVDLAGRHGHLLTHLRAGTLDLARVRVLTGQTRDLPDAHAGAVTPP